MLSKRFILLMCVIVLSCFASHSWAASGSASDPYIISTANDLAALRDRVNSGTETNGLYYKLSKNISLAKSYTDWEPIGTSTFPFSGHFDGNGFTITVNIDRGEEEAALFGTINSNNGYAIKKLNVKGTVKARIVSGIALDMYGGSIEECSFTGTLEGLTKSNSISGVAYGKEQAHAGGIISFLHSGTIMSCQVKDTTIHIAPANHENYVGGIAGKIFDGSILDCLVEGVTITGTVNRDKYGGNWGITTKAGGIVGGFGGGTVSNNEAYTTITGEAEYLYIGGVIGEIEEEGTIEDNKYGGPGFGIGCDYDEGIATDNPGCVNARGGTIDDPILIESTADLITLRDQIKNNQTFTGNNYYRLETDLVLSDWEPIGTEDNPFTGHFNGNGHTINLTIAERWDGASLFGTIRTNSDYAVKNLTVNAALKGRFVAGIALNLYSGSITDCTVSGTLYGITAYDPDYGTFSSYTGGIVEHMYAGQISRCIIRNALVITHPWYLAGEEDIEYSGGYVGGIVARMENGSIMNCSTDINTVVAGMCKYVTGVGHLAPIKTGRIVGIINSGTIEGNTSNAEVHGWGKRVRIGRIIGELKNATKIANNNYVWNGLSTGEINDDVYIGNGEKTVMARYGIGYNKAGIATDESGCENIGAGSSETNPFIIKTIDELRGLGDTVNSGSDVTELYYRLDTDLSIAAMSVIGTDDDTPFTGHFDGNGHTIEIDRHGSATTIASLFGSINTKDGYAVKNLNVRGILQGHFAGGIAVNLISGSIEDCTFSGTLTAYAPFEYPDEVLSYWKSTYAGGIATEITGGTIKNCTVINSHIISNPYYLGAEGYAGGIVAKMTAGRIENCIVSDTMIYGISQHQMSVYAFDSHGGIIHAGGIVGLYSSGVVKDNEAYTEVHGWTDSGWHLGGIIGIIQGTTTSTIENNKYTAIATPIAFDDGDDERNPLPFIPIEITRTLISDYCTRARIEGTPEDTLAATLGIGKNTNGIASDTPGCINTAPAVGLKIDAESFADAAFRNYVSNTIDTDSNGYLTDEEIAAIKTIDVDNRGIISLNGIELFINIETLSCHGNAIATLDISANTKLIRLDCSSNGLNTLDLSKNKALENIDCSDNVLTGLNLTNNTSLVFLDCINNKLTTLDVSHNTNLNSLYCGDNLLTELTLGDNDALTELSCENNNLERLDIGGCPNLSKDDITCDNNVDIIDGNDTDSPGIDLPTVMPEFKEVSIVLSGRIGVNFTMYLPGGIDYSDENKYYMEFAVKGGAANPRQACPAKMTDLGDGRKSAKFTCYINVAQMAEDITPTFYFNGIAITKPRSVSAKLYLNTVIGMDFPKTTKDLMYAIMDYGHYSQLMLAKENGWVINDKYAEMPCANEYNSDYFNEAKAGLAPYALSSYRNSAGLSGMVFSLSFASSTTLNLTLKLASSYTAVPSVTIDGVTCNSNNMKKSGNNYIVGIEGIPAHELNKSYTIMIEANGASMLKASALSYAHYVLNTSATAIGKVDIGTMRNAAIALYRYYDAAMAYDKASKTGN